MKPQSRGRDSDAETMAADGHDGLLMLVFILGIDNRNADRRKNVKLKAMNGLFEAQQTLQKN